MDKCFASFLKAAPKEEEDSCAKGWRTKRVNQWEGANEAETRCDEEWDWGKGKRRIAGSDEGFVAKTEENRDTKDRNPEKLFFVTLEKGGRGIRRYVAPCDGSCLRQRKA